MQSVVTRAEMRTRRILNLYITLTPHHFNMNYNYLNLDKPVIAAPRQQFNLGANYSYKIWNLNVSSQYIENLYSYTTADPTQHNIIEPDYLLLNARISAKPMNYLELFVSGNNLLNTQYEINNGYPMPGINFNAGFNVRF